MVDRLTHRVHIIETGSQSIRLEDALARAKQTGTATTKKAAKEKPASGGKHYPERMGPNQMIAVGPLQVDTLNR